MLEEKLFRQALSLASTLEARLFKEAHKRIDKKLVKEVAKKYDSINAFFWDIDGYRQVFRTFIYDILVEVPFSEIAYIKDKPLATMVRYDRHLGWPSEGLCLYQDRYVWFQLYADDYEEPDLGLRVFRLFELSDKEVEQAKEVYKLGNNIDFSSNKIILDKLYDFQFCIYNTVDDDG